MKQRLWVKWVAAVFFAVILLLTFFSNTLYNMTLPRVRTAAAGAGVITHTVSCTGTLEAAEYGFFLHATIPSAAVNYLSPDSRITFPEDQSEDNVARFIGAESVDGQTQGSFMIFGPNLQAGDQVTLGLYEDHAFFETVIPSAAILEDYAGTYIYTVESKTSPLGTRCWVNRVDVTILETNGKQTAIEEILPPGSQVVLYAESALSDGKAVRPGSGK